MLVRSSGAEVGRATAPGSRAASSRANGAASAGWVSATLIAVTVSSDPGSDGSAIERREIRQVHPDLEPRLREAQRIGRRLVHAIDPERARAGAGRLAGQLDDVADAQTACLHQLPRHEDARDRGRWLPGGHQRRRRRQAEGQHERRDAGRHVRHGSDASTGSGSCAYSSASRARAGPAPVRTPPQRRDDDLREIVRRMPPDETQEIAVHHRAEQLGDRRVDVEIRRELALVHGPLQQLHQLQPRRLEHAEAPDLAERRPPGGVRHQVRHEAGAQLRAGLGRMPAQEGDDVGANVTGGRDRGERLRPVERRHDFEAERALVRPVLVDGRLADARRLGDGVHAGGVDAVVGEETRGRVEHPRMGLLGPRPTHVSGRFPRIGCASS